MIDKKRLKEKAKQNEINLDENQLKMLDKYAEILVEWSKKMNLTSILQPEDIEDKHFLDSLLFAKQEEVAGSLVDVGTGAGFPGIVAKIFKPKLCVTLLEPTAKKVKFLQAVNDELALDVKIVNNRAEIVGREEMREKYDVVTARAVATLATLCEYCLPLVKRGGIFIAMKSGVQEEIDNAKNAISLLGANHKENREFVLPDGAKRSLIIIEKPNETPPKYPRNGAQISKRPL